MLIAGPRRRAINPIVKTSVALLAITLLAHEASSQPPAPVDQLIPWLLQEDADLKGVAFAEVIADATGKRVLPFDRNNEVDLRVLNAITAAANETAKRLNAPDNPIQKIGRINEVSSHFEDTLREILDAT